MGHLYNQSQDQRLNQSCIVDGLVYENWHEESFTLEQIRQQYKIDSAFGLDFGYTNDPSALFCGFIDTKNKKIFVYDEM